MGFLVALVFAHNDEKDKTRNCLWKANYQQTQCAFVHWTILTSQDFRFVGIWHFSAAVTKVCSLFNDIPNSLCFGILFQWLRHSFDLWQCTQVVRILATIFFSPYKNHGICFSIDYYTSIHRRRQVCSYDWTKQIFRCHFVYLSYSPFIHVCPNLRLIIIRLCCSVFFSVTIELRSYKSHKSQLN